MRRIFVCFGFVAFVAGATAAMGTGPTQLLAGCKYKGGDNALPATGTPYGVYGNGTMSPSGHVGFSSGSKSGYAQVSGDASGVQVEGNSDAAGQSGYVNTSAETGSC